MQIAKTAYTDLLNIDFPMMMAPMYFVSNENMITEAMNMGVAATMPAINWSTAAEMRLGINTIKQNTTKGALGIELLANELEEKLAICIALEVDYVICAIEIINEIISKTKGTKIKVFCEVLTLEQAEQAQSVGADAIIAINKNAMGKKGELTLVKLMSLLREVITLPIVVKGGIGEGRGFHEAINKHGADGCVLGSVFIASEESKASEVYKTACLYYGEKEIVETSKITGYPINVLKTNFIRRSSKEVHWVYKLLRKVGYFEVKISNAIFKKGFDQIKIAANANTKEKVWLAGTAIRYNNKPRKVSNIISSISMAYGFIEKEKTLMSRSVSR